MGGTRHILDKLLLATGLLLLLLLWINFPAEPQTEEHHYAATTYSGGRSTSKWTYLKPDQSLSPREVIRIQLMALQQNDRSDSGVLTVFNFSSPANRMHLGSITHFRLLVRDPAYRPILNFKKYEAGQLVITDNTAYQLVLITSQKNEQIAYMFILSKQRKGMYKGCWMTEGVARMVPERERSMI